MCRKRESLQQSFGDYFGLHKFVLKIGGISLGKDDGKFYKAYQIFVLFIFVSVILEEICMIVFRHRDIDINELAILISVGLTHSLGLLKFFVLIKNRMSIAASLDSLHGAPFAPNFKRGGSFEGDVIKEAITTTRLQFLAYYVCSTITIFNGHIMALISKLTQKDPNNWDMPWLPFALFEVSTSARYYLVYTWEVVSLTIFCYAIITTDLLIVAAFAHIRAQFYILGNFIGNMAPNDLAIDTSKIPKSMLVAKIKEAVVYHQALIELTEKFEDLFNVLILTVFSGNVLVLCFAMYLSTITGAGGAKITQEITYTLAIGIQVYFYCYYGNEITLAAESINAACYDVNFVGTDLSFQKGLLLIMIRCRRPIALTIGKFATLNIGSFISIMRASYSYYMVISNSSKKK